MANSRSYEPKKRTNRPLIAVVGALVIILCVTGGFFWQRRARKQAPPSTHTTEQITIDPVKEQSETDARKQQITDTETKPTTEQPKPTPSGLKNVTPVITYAGLSGGQIEVRGYVPGIFEEGGTCSAKFTQGGKTVTKTSTGFQDVNKTTCAPISASTSDLGTGDWNIEINYTSSKSEGTSTAYKFKVE